MQALHTNTSARRTPDTARKHWACASLRVRCTFPFCLFPVASNKPTVMWLRSCSHHTMLNILRILLLLLILVFSNLISPVFFNTTNLYNSSASLMDGWFKFTPVNEIHQGVPGRKRKPVSRLSKKLDHNSNKKNTLAPVDEIDHCCKRECFKSNHNLLQLQHLRNHYWSFHKRHSAETMV